MALTAFTSRLGIGQGRIRPEEAPAYAGDYVFVLGDDQPGRFFDLAVGDHADVTQSADVTGVTLVRAQLRLRVPASTPAGLTWEASMIVDNVKYASVRAKPGRERIVSDLAVNVSKMTGVHDVGVRLELITA